MLKIPIPKQPFDHDQFICDIGGRGEEDTVKRNGLGHCQDYEALRQSGKRKLFPVLLDFATLRDWECFDADAKKPGILYNSQNVPLYLFCFASANPKK